MNDELEELNEKMKLEDNLSVSNPELVYEEEIVPKKKISVYEKLPEVRKNENKDVNVNVNDSLEKMLEELNK